MNLFEWLRIEDPPPGRYLCPECRGGNSGEHSLSIWKAGPGRLKVAYCHRSSCEVSAIVDNSGYRTDSLPERLSVFTPNPYRGDNFPLRNASLERFRARFGFTPRMEGQIGTVAYTHPASEERYIIPITAPHGTYRGTMEAYYGSYKYRKIWKHKDEPMLSWTPGGDNYAGVWIVEDQISALKLWTIASVRAVALLGTHLSAIGVAEIKATTNYVTIALDADATAQAFDLARTWGGSFKSCRVQILQQDIKDMPVEAIREMIYAS